jgi:Kef-type K+ transport system membrane component KefB
VSAAAVGLVVPALRESRRTGTRLGQLVLISSVVAESLSLLGIIVLTVLVSGGAGWRLLSVPALLAAVGLVLWGLRRAAWWHPERFERLFRRDDPQEMGIRASLALLFVFVGLATLLEVEAILGAFLAGALFSFVFRRPGPLSERLRGFSFGFFIPVFFIDVGLSFPLDELQRPEALAEAGLLIAIAFVAKLVPSLALCVRRFSWRESLAAGALLAGQLSVVVALADLGLGLGLIGAGQHAGAILLVVVGAVLAPLLFQALAPPMGPRTARLGDSEAGEASG